MKEQAEKKGEPKKATTSSEGAAVRAQMEPQIQEQLKIALAESQEVLSKAQETIGQVEQSEDLKVTFKSALKILKERRQVLVEAHGKWPQA